MSRIPRRVLLGGLTVAVSGCLDHDDATDTGSANDGSDETGEPDTVTSFVLRGEFVRGISEERILPSDDERIAGRGLYENLFERVDEIPEKNREEGLTVDTTAVRRDSDVEKATLEAVTAAHEATMSDANTHPNDRLSSRRKTHYVEHDGTTLMVFIDTGGTPEGEAE